LDSVVPANTAFPFLETPSPTSVAFHGKVGVSCAEHPANDPLVTVPPTSPLRFCPNVKVNTALAQTLTDEAPRVTVVVLVDASVAVEPVATRVVCAGVVYRVAGGRVTVGVPSDHDVAAPSRQYVASSRPFARTGPESVPALSSTKQMLVPLAVVWRVYTPLWGGEPDASVNVPEAVTPPAVKTRSCQVVFVNTVFAPLATPVPRTVNVHGKTPSTGSVQPVNVPPVRVPTTPAPSFCSISSPRVELVHALLVSMPKPVPVAVSVPATMLAVVPTGTGVVWLGLVNRVSAEAAPLLDAKTIIRVGMSARRRIVVLSGRRLMTPDGCFEDLNDVYRTAATARQSRRAARPAMP
jgi:hypothetical protein